MTGRLFTPHSPTVEPQEEAESVRDLLQKRLDKTIEAEDIVIVSLSVYNDMLDSMVADIEHLLRPVDEAAEKAELYAEIAELKAAVAEAEKAVTRAKAAKPLKDTPVEKSKTKTKTKSGGERKANSYSSFMALLKGMPSVAEIGETEITADPQFSATALRSKGRYDEHRDQIMHDGQPLHGQTVTLQQAYDSITAAADVDPLFKNAAVRTAILWAMLSVEQRKEVVAAGRANGLCR